ncbi:MAG: AMP-binding protein [Chloroflexi bacterium]|nr:AMP-binding protein [Chloroflexota bacterium]
MMMILTQDTRPYAHTLLDARALTDPDDSQDAIIYVATGQPDVHVTRRELRTAVTRTAHALSQFGLQPGDLVIIAHTQNLESIFLFWGALQMGAVPSMFPTLTEKLDPAIYLRNLAELVRFSGVRAILTTEAFAPELADHVNCAVYSSTQLSAHAPTLHPPIANRQSPIPHHTAFLQHSSGTTGLQKGVALSHTAVLNQIAAYSEAIQLTAEDVIVSWLPLYHDMGLIAGFLLPLVQGIPLVLMSPFDWVQHPALLLKAIHAHQGTLCWLPNFAYNHCARRIRRRDLDGVTLASMRLFINCSEPVRHESHQLFLERFAEKGVTAVTLSVSYAMAENTFAVTQTPAGQPARLDVIDQAILEAAGRAQPVAADHPQAAVKVSCGPPVAGTAVRVLDGDGRVLPERIVGELAIHSPYMLNEYYRRPDLQPFQDGWFRTGDKGYLADGEVFVIGRSKDLIINAGKNVYPQDIEAIVNEIPGIHAGRAVVFGVPDEREGTELIAVVAESGLEGAAERQALGKVIRQEVARQSSVAVSFVQLVEPQWLIKTSSGKIARAANRDKWLRERADKRS